MSEAIIEACVDAMFVVDGDGYVQMINSAAAEQFKHEREELMGTNLATMISMEDGDWAESGSEILKQCLDISGGGTKKVELLARRRDGSTFPAQIGFRKVQLAAEEETPWHKIGADDKALYCGSVHDLTEHRRVLQLKAEQTKAEALLFNMLPAEIGKPGPHR